MKHLLTILFVISTFAVSAQTYTRGKKNFGVTLGSYRTLSTQTSKPFSGTPGFSLNIGASAQVGYKLYPMLQYKYTSAQLHHELIDPGPRAVFHSISLPIAWKLPIFGLYLGKSKKYECRGADISWIIGPEYAFNFGMNSVWDLKNGSDFFIFTGFEFLPGKSGGSKSNQRWTTHIDIIYKYALLNHIKSNDAGLPGNWRSHQLGIQLSILKHQIFKFSNM